MTGQVTSQPQANSKFAIKLICCGRDDGYVYAEDWQNANDFRNSYCEGTYYHDERNAVIESLQRTKENTMDIDGVDDRRDDSGKSEVEHD